MSVGNLYTERKYKIDVNRARPINDQDTPGALSAFITILKNMRRLRMELYEVSNLSAELS